LGNLGDPAGDLGEMELVTSDKRSLHHHRPHQQQQQQHVVRDQSSYYQHTNRRPTNSAEATKTAWPSRFQDYQGQGHNLSDKTRKRSSLETLLARLNQMSGTKNQGNGRISLIRFGPGR
jgi:hypothetical protein